MKNAGTHLPDVVLVPTAVRCTRPRFDLGLRPTLLPTRSKALGVPVAIGMRGILRTWRPSGSPSWICATALFSEVRCNGFLQTSRV